MSFEAGQYFFPLPLEISNFLIPWIVSWFWPFWTKRKHIIDNEMLVSKMQFFCSKKQFCFAKTSFLTSILFHSPSRPIGKFGCEVVNFSSSYSWVMTRNHRVMSVKDNGKWMFQKSTIQIVGWYFHLSTFFCEAWKALTVSTVTDFWSKSNELWAPENEIYDQIGSLNLSCKLCKSKSLFRAQSENHMIIQRLVDREAALIDRIS